MSTVYFKNEQGNFEIDVYHDWVDEITGVEDVNILSLPESKLEEKIKDMHKESFDFIMSDDILWVSTEEQHKAHERLEVLNELIEFMKK